MLLQSSAHSMRRWSWRRSFCSFRMCAASCCRVSLLRGPVAGGGGGMSPWSRTWDWKWRRSVTSWWSRVTWSWALSAERVSWSTAGAALLSAIGDRLDVGTVEALQASYIYCLYVPVLV